MGGEDFDNRLVDHFVQEFKRKFRQDVSQSKRALRRLRTECEKAKRVLSSVTQASIAVDSLYDGIDFYTSISRARFEELNGDLFRRTLGPVENAIRDANMNKSQIHDVVLVGGSTRIPKVQKLLQEFFDGRELNKSINPDESVAYGAAVQAAVLHGDQSKEVRDLILCDVTPLSLGTDVKGDIMCTVIPRNTPIPTKQTEYFTTCDDYQDAVRVAVYEGERARPADNNYLGEFSLTDLPPALRGVPKIEVTFDIDANGILNVSAVDTSTQMYNEITITNDRGRLSSDQILRMVNEAKMYKAEDDKRRAVVVARNSLESYCVDMKRAVRNELRYRITEEDRNFISYKCNETFKWMNTSKLAKAETVKRKETELRSAFNSIIR